MSDNWDFYFCHVDDQPASIFLDLGIAEQAPLNDFDSMAFIRLFMLQPRDDGLSSEEEFESLSKIEDTIMRQLCDDSTLFVARITSNGSRDFFFYLRDSESWESRVEDLRKTEFSGYEAESGARADPEWEVYFSLYPSDEDFQRMSDGRLLERMTELGDALTEPREIDHVFDFNDGASRDKFSLEVQKEGFCVREASDPNGERETYRLEIYRVDIPDYATISNITLRLFRLAKELNGGYDGWGCNVVK